ncbi:MAG: GDP-mannose 4,6-dehydratase [Solobacterium sp.]|nr:GDP-mannose 4,6-dehydratase [Solobacterium sp.]
MDEKNVLIIGAAGFVGGHLIDCIQRDEPSWKITATKMPREVIAKDGITVCDLDITAPEQIDALLQEVQPDYLFHLAAQSSVALSWKNPQLTIDINIKGAVNLLDALCRAEKKPRVLLIGSGEEYGHVKEDEVPIIEDNNTRPGNIYAVTKVCQNMIGKLYAKGYGLEIMSTRSFNHTGPNQAPIGVTADFSKQVAEIEKGLKEPVIHVGNLAAMRDFTDVRDVVRAYVLLMKLGKAGETYNVGSGKAVQIRSILDQILSHAKCEIEVYVDPEKLRPIDVPIIEADITKLQECTGWKPEISLDTTIQETLDWWRSRV